jgi:TRAP-type uncharacterized transport system substrate-binding protein
MKEEDRGFGPARLAELCTEYFGLTRAVSLITAVAVVGVVCLAIFWFVHSAPPRVITITSGPAGSPFEANAYKYAARMASNGVTLKILRSEGSWENLKRLEDPKIRVDVGFVQGGIADGTNADRLVSLGSISYEPLLVFYRGTNTIRFLSQFEGKRLAIGPEGSGSHLLAMELLATNGVAPGGSTQFSELEATDAAQALLTGSLDAVFLTSDSASSLTIRTLLRAPGIHLMSFEQADAYTRRFNYLNKLRLPEGVIDFKGNLPPGDLWLIGPTVELVARPDLNPAVSDILLEAAQAVNSPASFFQNQGEFPAPLVHEYTISPDALRYYKSGKKFLYRQAPFWIASLINRIMVAFVPVALVLIPALRLLPAAYRWRAQLRIYRWYRKLLVLERDVAAERPPGRQEDFVRRLNEIEMVVQKMKVPASFANLFYSLREHIDYVRARLDARSYPPGR